jgi:hypothetical protein
MSMVNFTKKMITCSYDTYMGKWDIKEMQELVEKHVPAEYKDSAYFDFNEEDLPYDSGTRISLRINWIRQETDEEFKKRKDEYNAAIERKKKQDLAELERLKKLYES